MNPIKNIMQITRKFCVFRIAISLHLRSSFWSHYSTQRCISAQKMTHCWTQINLLVMSSYRIVLAVRINTLRYATSIVHLFTTHSVTRMHRIYTCLFRLDFLSYSKIKSMKEIYNEHDLRHSVYCMTYSRSIGIFRFLIYLKTFRI